MQDLMAKFVSDCECLTQWILVAIDEYCIFLAVVKAGDARRGAAKADERHMDANVTSNPHWVHWRIANRVFRQQRIHLALHTAIVWTPLNHVGANSVFPQLFKD